MTIFLIYFSAFLFALMGIGSIVWPRLTAAQFGILELNERVETKCAQYMAVLGWPWPLC